MVGTGVATKGAFEVTCFELPDFNGAVLGAGGEGWILGVEGECSDVWLVTFKFEFGRGDWYVELFSIGIDRASFFDCSFELFF